MHIQTAGQQQSNLTASAELLSLKILNIQAFQSYYKPAAKVTSSAGIFTSRPCVYIDSLCVLLAAEAHLVNRNPKLNTPLSVQDLNICITQYSSSKTLTQNQKIAKLFVAYLSYFWKVFYINA
jgi:hypothetical protein